MRRSRIVPMLLVGAVACGEAPGEHEANDSPYGELQVARAEEVSPTPTPPRRRSEPGRAVPVAPAPARDTVAPETARTERAQPPDTAGYVPYPAEPEAVEAPAVPEPPPEAVPAAADPAAVPSIEAERTVPAGTTIHAALEDSIHSRLDVSGKVVEAKVMQNVRGPDGRTLIPAGAPVRLTVTQVKPGRGDRKGVLEIRADSITVGGEARKLEARLQPVSHELRGRGVTGEEAAKVGVGAAGGAVVGRVIGGNTKGAVIGGVVGAAGGAVVASETAAKDVVVKARTPVVLVLTAPLPAGS